VWGKGFAGYGLKKPFMFIDEVRMVDLSALSISTLRTSFLFALLPI
jgi:hypothetical protein